MKYIVRSFFFSFFLLQLISCNKDKVVISTNSISSLTATSVVCGGEVKKDGGSEITSKGVCWSSSTSSPVVGTDNFTKDGSGIGVYTSSVSNLKHNTTYYIRAYAKNNSGYHYGDVVTFTTPKLVSTTIPIVFTYPVTNVDSTNLVLQLNGEVIHEGGDVTTERGFVFGTKQGPSITDNKVQVASGLGEFSYSFPFEMSKVYYVRSYAINSFGVAYGDDLEVRIDKAKPKAYTLEVTEIDSNTAYVSGVVSYAGGSQIISKGICWASHSNPTVNDFKTNEGAGLGSFTSFLTGMLPNSVYYCRSYAENSEGFSYGEEIQFKTLVSQLYIGMEYKGGIIFYLNPNQNEKGGLVITTADISTSYSWGCSGVLVDNTLKTFGSGQSNTDLITSTCSSGAAKLCADYVVGKYDDWYLPSQEELALIYTNLKVKDLEKFSTGYYWSSTEKSSTVAYRYGFLGGNLGEADKSSSQYVRAIRKF